MRIIEEVPADVMGAPLDWLFAEHFRQRQLCRLLQSLADARTFQGDPIIEAVAFLKRDLPLHLLDEEEDLFPLLRRRCEPGELDKVLGALSVEHYADLEHAREVLCLLRGGLETRRPPGLDAGARKVLVGFAAQEQRHLALENAVVLPIARRRLTGADLSGLGQRMAARRGVAPET